MGTQLQCSYSTVSSEELMSKVIPDYCIDDPLECIFWRRGSNDTYLIRCANARYAMRLYRHQNYPRDELDFEVDALNYLHRQGFPVAYPVARKTGGYVTEISALEGVRYLLITTFAEGNELDCNTVGEFRQYGESLGRLHEASQGFKTPHKKKNLDLKNFIDDSVKSIAPFLVNRPKELALLVQYVENARSEVERAGKEGMDVGFCHGDVHGGNAHLHDNVLTHFDFEECGFGYRVFDLATFKWAFDLDDSKSDNWQAFVAGYESVRKIKSADLKVLDTFVLLRHVWLIAYHMRNSHDFGGELTSDGYIDHQWSKLKSFNREGIGAALSVEGEYTRVVSVVENGPAALSGEVHADDRIIGVGSGSDGEIKDITGLALNEVIDMIAGPKGSVVQLKIVPAKASDSQFKVISLMRDKIKP